MANSGKSGAFSFAAVLYGSSACLQSHSLDRSINEVIYQCSGTDKVAVGTSSAVFTASLALATTEASKVKVLEQGATGAFIYYPIATTSSAIKLSATKGTVVSSAVGGGPNSIITLDVSIRCDDMTATSV